MHKRRSNLAGGFPRRFRRGIGTTVDDYISQLVKQKSIVQGPNTAVQTFNVRPPIICTQKERLCQSQKLSPKLPGRQGIMCMYGYVVVTVYSKRGRPLIRNTTTLTDTRGIRVCSYLSKVSETPNRYMMSYIIMARP